MRKDVEKKHQLLDIETNARLREMREHERKIQVSSERERHGNRGVRRGGGDCRGHAYREKGGDV